MRARTLIAVVSLLAGCGDGGDAGADAGTPCDRPTLFEKSPGAELEGAGWHRVYVQGGQATPDADGRFGMSEQRVDLATGDHFVLSSGALVEWIYPVGDAITGEAFFHIARVDDPGVVGRYELFLVHDGEEIELATVDDPDNGEMGYVPFEACLFGGATAVDPSVGDYLLLRVTNLTGGTLGVVTRAPDYFTWIDVDVQ